MSGRFAYRPGMWELLRQHVPAPSTVVEIGTRRGHWVQQLLFELPETRRVYCVDPWRTNGRFAGNIGSWVENLGAAAFERVVPLRGTSEEWGIVCPFSVDLLFIDGKHSYNAVSLDLRLWYPKIRRGGIVLIHDMQVPSVQRAVNEFFAMREERPEIAPWGPEKPGFEILTAWVRKE